MQWYERDPFDPTDICVGRPLARRHVRAWTLPGRQGSNSLLAVIRCRSGPHGLLARQPTRLGCLDETPRGRDRGEAPPSAGTRRDRASCEGTGALTSLHPLTGSAMAAILASEGLPCDL